jgi:predicted esterase
MPPRVPLTSDFASSLTLTITPPPNNQPPLNILILLHGLGDTHVPFSTLGRSLSLPYTACISLRAPSPIPALFTGSDIPAFHWGDDVLFDSGDGGLDLDAGFTKSVKILKEVVEACKRCGVSERGLFFWGFGQGGIAALAIVRSFTAEFGGVVSIGGRLPASSMGEGKSRTPVLVCGGSKSREITRGRLEELKGRFADVEYVKWEKPDDSMPKNREEMLPIMKFLARRLKSGAGVPEDAVEL